MRQRCENFTFMSRLSSDSTAPMSKEGASEPRPLRTIYVKPYQGEMIKAGEIIEIIPHFLPPTRTASRLRGGTCCVFSAHPARNPRPARSHRIPHRCG